MRPVASRPSQSISWEPASRGPAASRRTERPSIEKISSSTSAAPGSRNEKRVPFHLEICPGVDLSRFDIHMTEEIANHVERDSTLQQVHSLGMAQRVWTHGTVQTGTLISGSGEIFLKDVADS